MKKVRKIVPVIVLVLAIPLFVWGLIKFNGDIRQRAASGEPVPAESHTVTLNAIADTYIANDTPNTDLGSTGDLSVGEFNNGTNKIRRILIKFDLSKFPAGSKITSAKLSLFLPINNGRYSRPSVSNVYRLKRDWVESKATWNVWKSGTGGKWATAGASGDSDIDSTVIGSRNMLKPEPEIAYKDWSLTPSAIQDMLTGGSFTNNGFLIRSDKELNDGYIFFSSNITNTAKKPKLVITYEGDTYPGTEEPAPVPTVTPPPVTGDKQSINVLVKFKGVYGDGADNAKIKLRFKSSDGVINTETTLFTVHPYGDQTDSTELRVYSAAIELTGDNILPTDKTYSVYVKGEKHIQVKFCKSDLQTTRCSATDNGSIQVPNPGDPTVTYSFVGIPLVPGDLPNPQQDNVANLTDYTKVQEISNAKSCDSHTQTDDELKMADLNYDGCVNTIDILLMRQTLETVYDEN